jgi:hypothetical protein
MVLQNPVRSTAVAVGRGEVQANACQTNCVYGTLFFLQVLVDTILQLEEVISCKRRIQAGQQQDVSTNSSRYVTQLLSKVTPDQVQHILTWTPDAWRQAFSKAMTALPILLDVVRREDLPAGDPAAYLPIAEQQLNEVCAVHHIHTRMIHGYHRKKHN